MIFNSIPDNFFNLLSSKNKVIYSDLWEYREDYYRLKKLKFKY